MSIAAAPPQAPSALVRLPEMSTDDKQRVEAIQKRRKAFCGEFDVPFKKQSVDEPNFNILDNRCSPVVLKGMYFLFGQPLSVSVKLAKTDQAADTVDNDADAADDDPGESPEQLYLDAALGDIDDFMTLLSEGAINGGVTGHVFIKIVEAAKPGAYPRLIVLNPETVWVETDPDDCRCVVAFNIQYKAKDANGHDIWKRQRIWQEEEGGDSWTCQWYSQPCDAMGNAQSGWRTLGAPVIWDYPFPPIAHAPNMPNPNEFWGMTDLTDDFIAMNKHLNLIQSNIAKLLYFYGHPYLFADAGTGQINITPGVLIGVPQGTNITSVQATGDLANARAFAADLRSDMDELSRVPAVALGRITDLPRGNISGVALELLFQPLLEKTHLKRRLYGRMIRDVCQRILALGGHGDGESLPVNIHWPELMPKDELQILQALQLKEQLGWSLQTIMEEAGGDYQEEMLRKKQEAEADQSSYNQGQGPAPQVNALAKQGVPPQLAQQLNNPAMQAQQQKLTEEGNRENTD